MSSAYKAWMWLAGVKPMSKPCCELHNDNCVDIEEACCWDCPLYNGTGTAEAPQSTRKGDADNE